MPVTLADFKILTPRLVQTTVGRPQKGVHLNPNKPLPRPKKKAKGKKTFVP